MRERMNSDRYEAVKRAKFLESRVILFVLLFPILFPLNLKKILYSPLP